MNEHTRPSNEPRPSGGIIGWVRASPKRIVWLTTCTWTVLIVLVLGGAQADQLLSSVLVAALFGAIMSTYLAALDEGWVARLDERWRLGLQAQTVPGWTAWVRLLLVVGPSAVFGWVPRRLFGLALHRLVPSRPDHVVVFEGTLEEEIQATLSQIRPIFTTPSQWRIDDEMLDSDAWQYYFNTIVEKLVDAELLEEAESLLNAVRSELPAFHASAGEDSILFPSGVIATHYGTLGKLDELAQLADDAARVLPVVDESPTEIHDTLLLAGLQAVAARDISSHRDAEFLLMRMTHEQHRAQGLGMLVKAEALHGNLDAALTRLSEVDQLNEGSGRLARHDAVEALLEQRLWEAALIIARSGPRASQQSLLFLIAEWLAKHGLLDDARVVRAEGLASLPPDSRDNSEPDWTRARYAGILAELGKESEALAFLRSCERDWARKNGFRWIAEAAVRNVGTLHAVGIVEANVADPDERDELFRVVAEEAFPTRDLDEVFGIARRIRDPQIRDETIAALVDRAAAVGNIEHARQLAQQVLDPELAERCSATIARVTTLDLATHGKLEDLFAAAEHMPEGYEYKLRDIPEELIRALARQGRINEAREALTSFDPAPRMVSLLTLYAERQLLAEAEGSGRTQV